MIQQELQGAAVKSMEELEDIPEERRALMQEKKKLKRLCKLARKEWFEEKWNRIKYCDDMADWWRVVNEFRPRKRRAGEGITKVEYLKHFSKLLGSEDADEKVEDQENEWPGQEEGNEELDSDQSLKAEIGKEEFFKTLRRRKNKKAGGEDGRIVEFIKAKP